MVDGWRAGDQWHFENRLGGETWETPTPGHTTKVLMMEIEDDE
jgi:hypothetical protein